MRRNFPAFGEAVHLVIFVPIPFLYLQQCFKRLVIQRKHVSVVQGDVHVRRFGLDVVNQRFQAVDFRVSWSILSRFAVSSNKNDVLTSALVQSGQHLLQAVLHEAREPRFVGLHDEANSVQLFQRGQVSQDVVYVDVVLFDPSGISHSRRIHYPQIVHFIVHFNGE